MGRRRWCPAAVPAAPAGGGAAAAGGEGGATLGTGVFVPDEEAAGWLTALEQAMQPAVAAGVWPGWVPSQPAAVALRDGLGALVHGWAGAGRPIAGRGGGVLDRVVLVPAAEVASWTGTAAGGAAGGRGDGLPTARDAAPIVLAVDEPSAAALAEVFYAAAFRRSCGLRAQPEAGAPPRPAAVEDPGLIALAHLEGRLLAEAVGPAAATGSGTPGLEALALQVALVRRERRALLDDAAVAEERQAERELGLPAYVGRRCALRLGASRLGPREREALQGLGRQAQGERYRLSGCALALLLDLLGARPWGGPRSASTDGAWGPVVHGALGEGGRPAGGGDAWRCAELARVDLDAALERLLAFDGGARDDAALAAAQRRHDFPALWRAERDAVAEAEHVRQALVDQILQGPGTLLVCDVRGLGVPVVVPHAPPEAVNASVELYRVGGTFRYAGGRTVIAREGPVAHDRRAGLLQMRVATRLAFSVDLQGLRPGDAVAFDQGLALEVPGLRIAAGSGQLVRIDGEFLVRLTLQVESPPPSPGAAAGHGW